MNLITNADSTCIGQFRNAKFGSAPVNLNNTPYIHKLPNYGECNQRHSHEEPTLRRAPLIYIIASRPIKRITTQTVDSRVYKCALKTTPVNHMRLCKHVY